MLELCVGPVVRGGGELPGFKADQNFRQLQEEPSETEDKVAFARQYYNDNVREWNTRIASVPDNLVAGLMRAEKAEYFELEGGAGAARRSVSSECSAPRLGRARRLVAGVPAGIPRRTHRCGSRGRTVCRA